MSRKRKKNSSRAKVFRRNVPAESPQSGSRFQGTNDLVLRGSMPGALMYQRPYPPGVLTHDPPRRSQINLFADSGVFRMIPRDERDAVFSSIGRTYTRAAHYEARFQKLRSELEHRRINLPGEIFWDGLVDYVHFELQAFAGACRTLVDELVYIIARRHGVDPEHARHKPWETSRLVKEPLPQECDVEEVRALRSASDWFATLNAYRNSFFHHGWRHGHGHFSEEDVRFMTSSPASNGLLVPDRASLGKRSKPFEWTWDSKTTVDAVAAEVRRGTDWLLEEMGRIWEVPIPPPGTMPLHEFPNLFVALVRPVFLFSSRAVFLPLFSTRECALAFHEFSTKPELEVVDVPVSTAYTRDSSVALGVHGFDAVPIGPGVSHVEVVIDPKPDNVWRDVMAPAPLRFPIASVAKLATDPLCVPIEGLTRVWLWRRAQARPW